MLCRGLGEPLTLITHSLPPPPKKKCTPPQPPSSHFPQAHPHHCGLCSKCWAYHSITNRKKIYPKVKNSLSLLQQKISLPSSYISNRTQTNPPSKIKRYGSHFVNEGQFVSYETTCRTSNWHVSCTANAGAGHIKVHTQLSHHLAQKQIILHKSEAQRLLTTVTVEWAPNTSKFAYGCVLVFVSCWSHKAMVSQISLQMCLVFVSCWSHKEWCQNLHRTRKKSMYHRKHPGPACSYSGSRERFSTSSFVASFVGSGCSAMLGCTKLTCARWANGPPLYLKMDKHVIEEDEEVRGEAASSGHQQWMSLAVSQHAATGNT